MFSYSCVGSHALARVLQKRSFPAEYLGLLELKTREETR